MSPYQYQYYSFLEKKRRQAINNACLVQFAYGQIKDAVDHGIIPWEDPEYNKYWVLLSEDDQQKFISEIEGWPSSQKLTFEDDTEEPVK